MTEYNPLENYSMVEERTPDLTFEDTENVNTEVTTERETSAENKYKGFNATDPVLVNQTDGDETTTTTGASADNETHKVTTHTGTETLTRSAISFSLCFFINSNLICNSVLLEIFLFLSMRFVSAMNVLLQCLQKNLCL